MTNLKTNLNSFKNSSEAKTLVGNFAWLSALQFASYLFPLITMPYLARVIGVDGFGKIAFASAIVVWFQTIADWGFNFTATRDVAQNRDNPQKVSEIFSNVLWARCFLMVLSLIVLLGLIVLIPQLYKEAEIILITFLLIPGHILFPDWFFQAIERMKYITILNLLIKTIFTFAVFIFINDKEDYILQPLLISIGYIAAGIIALYFIIFNIGIKLKKPQIKNIIATIKNSTNVFLNNIIPNLYSNFSIILLGFFSGSTANGILEAGRKFVIVGQQIMNTISRAFFPFLSRRIEKHKIYAVLNLTSALILSIILFIIAPILIKFFFTPEFYESILIFRILVFSIIFLSINNIYGTNYLIITHNEKKLRNATALASLIGFIIAFPLIYLYNAVGAAITITLTRGILSLFTYIQAHKSRIQ